jgi:hypothetical protein
MENKVQKKFCILKLDILKMSKNRISKYFVVKNPSDLVLFF